MNPWFRFYREAINDPKILRLPEATRWHWVAILCVASGNSGQLPSPADIALMLRVTPQKANSILSVLHAAGLLDKTDQGFTPHNWGGRQYKSDVSTERVKRFRNGQKRVSETPPEQNRTEQSQKRSTSDIENAISLYARFGHWSRWAGPEPGLTGCKATAEQLAKFGLGPDGKKLVTQ